MSNIDQLQELWQTEKHRYIYDPFIGVMSFNDRRPTDYKFNCRVNLPKPLDDESEYNCEFKRRSYMDTFESYLSKHATAGKDNNNMSSGMGKKNSDMIMNLNKNERQGFESLCDRINSGVIMVTPTDKSGRFSVLTRDQYLESGHTHTDKDEMVTWDDIRYLKNQEMHICW